MAMQCDLALSPRLLLAGIEQDSHLPGSVSNAMAAALSFPVAPQDKGLRKISLVSHCELLWV